MEFSSSRYGSQFHNVLCDSLGTCVIYEKANADSKSLIIEHYSAEFQLKDKQIVGVSPTKTYDGAIFHQGDVFVVLHDKNKKKKEKTGLLVQYHCQSQLIDTLSIGNLPTDDISHLTAYEGNLFFTSATSKNNENLFFLNPNSKYASALFLPNAPDYTIDDFVIDTVAQKVMICANTSSNSRNNVIWICETDLSGNILFVTDLPDTSDYRFQNARIVSMGQGRFFIAGTYQQRKSSLYNTADGTFVTYYENHRFTNTRRIEYSKRNHLYDTEGRSELLYLPGKIFHDSTRYAFVSEAFYPEYRYSTTYSYGIPSTEAIFLGYNFLSAHVVIFDTIGELLWKYEFPFEKALVTNLTPHLRINFLDNHILMYYQIGQAIYTMLTDNAMEVVDPLREAALYPTTDNTTQKRVTTSLTHWYDDYYMLAGYRMSKDKAPTFFLTKLRYR